LHIFIFYRCEPGGHVGGNFLQLIDGLFYPIGGLPGLSRPQRQLIVTNDSYLSAP